MARKKLTERTQHGEDNPEVEKFLFYEETSLEGWLKRLGFMSAAHSGNHHVIPACNTKK
jgi:hypothetical protein